MTEMGTPSRVVVLVAVVLLAYGGPVRARPPGVRPTSERRTPSAKALLREELSARIAERRRLPLSNSTARAASGPACESTGFEATEATCQWEKGWICGSTFTSCVSDHDTTGVCTGDPIVDASCCADDPNPLNGWYTSISSQHCNEPHIDTANPASGTQHLRFQRDPDGGAHAGDGTGCVGLNSACRSSAFTPSVGPQPIGPTTISFDLSFSLSFRSGAMNYFTIADSEINPIGPNFLWAEYGNIYIFDPRFGSYSFAHAYIYPGLHHHFEVLMDPCSGVVNYTQNGRLIYSHDFTNFPFTVERALFTHNNGGEAPWDLDNYTVTRGEPCGACCDLIVGSCSQVASVDDCSGNNMVYSENKNCTLVECTAITAACCDSSPGAGGECRDTISADCEVGDQVTWSKSVTCGDGLCAETPGACCDTGPGSGGLCEEVLLEDCPVGAQVGWTKGVSCSDGLCAETPGSCCDSTPGLGGMCEETLLEDCPVGAQVTWTKAQSCADAGCTETTGACCNLLAGTCTDGILSANCSGDQRVWTKDAICDEVACGAVLGACCDSGTENPTIASCSTTTVTECGCAKCTWHKLQNCDAIVCDPNFAPIPTVSQWGLVILTLLLLVVGKVHFGRRDAPRRSD